MCCHLVGVVVDSLAGEVPGAVGDGDVVSLDCPLGDVNAVRDVLLPQWTSLVVLVHQRSQQAGDTNHMFYNYFFNVEKFKINFVLHNNDVLLVSY